MSKQGFIYVAVQEDRPGYCKVGKTQNLADRAKNLGGSAQVKISIVGSVRVEDMDAVEKAFHKILPETNRNGEWFNIEKEKVLPMLDCVSIPEARPGKTSSGEFCNLIVDVLKGLRGSGRQKDVIDLVGVRAELLDGDRDKHKNGEIVWKRSVREARRKLEKEGQLKCWPCGLWELISAPTSTACRHAPAPSGKRKASIGTRVAAWFGRLR